MGLHMKGLNSPENIVYREAEFLTKDHRGTKKEKGDRTQQAGGNPLTSREESKETGGPSQNQAHLDKWLLRT